MLWSLLKVLIFIAIVAGLAIGVGYLTELDEAAMLTVAGREFVLTPIMAIVLALVLLLAVWLLFKAVALLVATLRFLNGDETAISRHFNRRAERKGFEALAEGMMALAAGEGRLAIRKAERAEKYLHRPELTKLILAQGAEMTGDRKLAMETYKALVTDDRTRFVGVRGLMKQKLEAGDTDTALKLAEKALALRPRNEEVQTTLLQLQARHEDWAGARATLSKALKAGNLPRDLHKRRDAVLALAHAREAMAQGKIAEATRDATEANRLAPTLVPAAAMATRLAIAEKNPRKAAKILKAAWANEPHPDLAAAFAEIEPNETPAARLKRFQPLLAKHPGHPETKLLEAELQIAREDFPAARRALGDLAETKPTTRSLTIMAAIERGQGAEDRVVRAWLARAVTAPRGPQWLCGNCGQVHAEWRPVCANCESFDTLAWAEAPQSEAALAGPAQMLPMIVGALEDRRDTQAEDAETVEDATPPETDGTRAADATAGPDATGAEPSEDRSSDTAAAERN
ncbi:heme biosynthesis HemY N-terminal domain-containing protein [Roseibacterium sp. SDUM158017]|uniref:heme biosynthesis protein HemY n=1 Tax=Roseicyclus salinarum TaxID=3036773 RepID=UPI0024157E1F|nr:heme biosynthesis HemY N-terminal domain-containing protein [Roseibacterium sp. SDUM158017]MDG4649224.1 heme biosynthesis HemY N-terminal domain-containing protein [Roseibacterium sp. SDUM158017]